MKPTKQFVGCGVVISGDYIATCRHVWDRATAGDEPDVEIEYPHVWRQDDRTTTAVLADPCRAPPDGPEPDLVLLQPLTVPRDVTRLTPATLERFEVGDGHVYAGLPGLDDTRPSARRELEVAGTIAVNRGSDGRRQFTGANPASLWTDRGSSGSPVFVGTGEQLAGILSLSTTSAKRPGESPVHAAWVVPGTVVRRYLDAQVALRQAAQQAHVSADRLRPILNEIGAGDASPEEMPDRLRQFVEQARARAAEPVAQSNDGRDIDAAIDAARDKLRDLDVAGARDLLQAKIDEDEQWRRQRLLPLLRERAAIERLAFDHESAKRTLAEIARLDPDDVRSRGELGDIHLVTGSTDAAEEAYRSAAVAAERVGDERDLSVSHNKIGDVQRAQGDLAGGLASYQAGMAIREPLASRDPANSEWQRDLSVSHERIGDVQQAQGDLAGALASYQAGMTIRERLASRDPANSEWQRDLIVSYVKVAGAAPGQARPLLTRALAIARELARAGRLAPVDAWMPSDLEDRIAGLPPE